MARLRRHPAAHRGPERPRRLGHTRSYDTKLARQTKAGTILQLAVYSDLLADVQGLRPDTLPRRHARRRRIRCGATAWPTTKPTFRQISWELEGQVESRRASDRPVYLSRAGGSLRGVPLVPRIASLSGARTITCGYVAGISRVHRRELQSQGITTLSELAQMPVPLTFKPSRGSKERYERLQDQARLQDSESANEAPGVRVAAAAWRRAGAMPTARAERGRSVSRSRRRSVRARRGEGIPVWDWVRQVRRPPGARGCRECRRCCWRQAGDAKRCRRFLRLRRRRTSRPSTTPRGGPFDDREERAAFEAVVDCIMARWAADPNMHVYHFGHYEPSALKRLMGRYATAKMPSIAAPCRTVRRLASGRPSRRACRRRELLDQAARTLLRLRPGRPTWLTRALHRRKLEIALETQAIGIVGDAVKEAVEHYNRDDCRSTLALRDWLEALRARVIAEGHPVARPAPKPPDAARQKVSELQARVAGAALRSCSLTCRRIRQQRSTEQQTRWLLAYLLDWHRREDKVDVVGVLPASRPTRGGALR